MSKICWMCSVARGWTVGGRQLSPAASFLYSASNRSATSFMVVPSSLARVMSLSSMSVMLET